MSIAVITGAASGIGAEVRKRLEAQGYDVIGIDLRNTEVTADLSTEAGRTSAITETLKKCGGKIDRLLLAAGLGGHLDNGALVARVNYFGAVALLDGFKDSLSASSGKCVVIGSNSAQMRPVDKTPIVEAMMDDDEAKTMDIIGDMHAAMVYAPSKHALTRAARRRAADWGSAGIQMNIIAPGPTETPMLQGVKDHPTISKSLDMIPIPQKRFAQVEEIAGVIEFLFSETAAHMHGSVIYVDGGSDAQVRPDSF